MSINKYNIEGYHDPTAYEALLAITKEEKKSKFKPLIYICSPFTGDRDFNINRAKGYSRFAVSKNAIPIAPQLLFSQFMDHKDSVQRSNAIFMSMILMHKCNEVWCFGSRITKDMQTELEKAKKRNIHIRYFNERCEEVKGNA